MSGRVVYPGWSGGRPPSEPGEPRRSWRRRVAVWGIPVAGLLVALLAWLLPRDGSPDPAPAAAEGRVEIAQSEWSNVPVRYRRAGTTEVQTQKTLPTLDLTLLNHSARTVLVKRAKVVVEDSASLYTCYTQGGGPVPVSARVDVLVPPTPTKAERTVEHRLFQQIPPEGALRIQLRFAAPRAALPETAIHRVRVSLVTTGEQETLDAGRLVVAIPGVPAAQATAIPDLSAFGLRDDSGPMREIAWCALHNRAAFLRVADGRAARSDAFRAVERAVRAHPALPPGRSESPRAAAEALLGGAEVEPLYAVTAADATGDDNFAADIRDRAAQALLANARSDDSPTLPRSAAARESLALQPSAEAEQLVTSIERTIDAP